MAPQYPYSHFPNGRPKRPGWQRFFDESGERLPRVLSLSDYPTKAEAATAGHHLYVDVEPPAAPPPMAAPPAPNSPPISNRPAVPSNPVPTSPDPEARTEPLAPSSSHDTAQKRPVMGGAFTIPSGPSKGKDIMNPPNDPFKGKEIMSRASDQVAYATPPPEPNAEDPGSVDPESHGAESEDPAEAEEQPEALREEEVPRRVLRPRKKDVDAEAGASSSGMISWKQVDEMKKR